MSRPSRAPQRPPACQPCRRRKGKCDFRSPCGSCCIRGEESLCEYSALAPEPRPRRQTALRGTDVDRLRAQVSHLQTLLDRSPERTSDLPDIEAAVGSVGEQLNSLVLDRVLFPRPPEPDDVLSQSVKALFSAPHGIVPLDPPSSYDLFYPSPPEDIVASLQRVFPPKSDAFLLLESFLSFSNLVHSVVDPRIYRPALEAYYSDPSHPLVQDVGFLASMLAIFAHGLSSIDDGASLSFFDSEGCRHAFVSRWLSGSLQGISYKMSAPSGNVGIESLRAAGLVAWFCFFFGDDSLVRPAISLNAKALFVACDGYAMHRDPQTPHRDLSEDVQEDYRRLFWFLTTQDWTLCSVIGRSYSPVSPEKSTSVRLPSFIPGRDSSKEHIANLQQHIEIISVLWKITGALHGGSLSYSRYRSLEEDLEHATRNVPFDSYPPESPDSDQPQPPMDGPSSALFTQNMLLLVQARASYVKLHGVLAIPKDDSPQWVTSSQPRHLETCVKHARELLQLQRHQLSAARRHKGHSGFPRFHPIYGGLILASLILLCPDLPDREVVLKEVEDFVNYLRSFKKLSAITLRGAEVLQQVLNEVRYKSTPEGSSTQSSSHSQPHSHSHSQSTFQQPETRVSQEQPGANQQDAIVEPLAMPPILPTHTTAPPASTTYLSPPAPADPLTGSVFFDNFLASFNNDRYPTSFLDPPNPPTLAPTNNPMDKDSTILSHDQNDQETKMSEDTADSHFNTSKNDIDITKSFSPSAALLDNGDLFSFDHVSAATDTSTLNVASSSASWSS